MTGQDLGTGIGNTIAGAGQGALQGAVAGGVMSGANKAFNKLAPKAAQAMQENVARNASYGDTMREQFKGAWNSGDSPVANRLVDMGAGTDNGFGLRYNKFAGDGAGAIDYLLKRGGGEVEGAVKSPAVEAITGDGNIDLVYGKGGDDGYGLAHILEKHGEAVARKIPDILQNGKVVDDPAYTNNSRITLVDNNNTGAVRLGWDGNKKQWVVTAYEGLPYSSASSANSVSDGTTLRGSSVQSSNDATVNSILPQSEQNVNFEDIIQAVRENRLRPSYASNGYTTTDMGKIYQSGDLDYISKLEDAFREAGQAGVIGAAREQFLGRSTLLPQSERNVNSDSANNSALLSKSRFDNYDFNATVNNNNRRAMAIGLDPSKVSDEVYARTQSLDTNRMTTRQWAQLLNDTTDAVISDMVGDMGVSSSAVSSQSPETEIYRTLTGETTPRNTDLMYGESELGNRTRRGMVADALERLGNTLEGAQTNVTRAAAKDLGIQSTGKVAENVRKKTGLTNLETQAAFARELTGGADSLMDNIRVSSLNC